MGTKSTSLISSVMLMILACETASLCCPVFPEHTYPEQIEAAREHSHPLASGPTQRHLIHFALSCGCRLLDEYTWRVGRKVAAYTTSQPALLVNSHQGRMLLAQQYCPPSLDPSLHPSLSLSLPAPANLPECILGQGNTPAH